MYYSVYYMNILITMFLTTFRRFPKNIQNCSEGLTNVSEHFPKIAEDLRGGTDDVSIIQHHLWVLFKRLCSYSNGNLKTCIFTCEILIKHRCLYNKKCYNIIASLAGTKNGNFSTGRTGFFFSKLTLHWLLWNNAPAFRRHWPMGSVSAVATF